MQSVLSFLAISAAIAFFATCIVLAAPAPANAMSHGHGGNHGHHHSPHA